MKRPRPSQLSFTPKYRDVSIRRSYTNNNRSVEANEYRDRLLAEQMNNFGFSKTFLRLHFVLQYAAQALAQLVIVIWSIVRFGIQGDTVTEGDLWLSVVGTIDVAITILLVTDLLSHLTDSAKVYWIDWGNRIDAFFVGLVVVASSFFLFSPMVKAEEASAYAFAFLLGNDVVRVVRIAIFLRRIKRAIVWSKESLGYASSKGYAGKKQILCSVFPDLSKQCPILVGQEPQSLFAIYDGEGGMRAAEYASKHLPMAMAEEVMFPDNALAAMSQAFASVSEQVYKLPGNGNSKSRTGSTCLLIRERELYIAWVGGSHAVLCQDGKAICLTGQGEYDQSETLGATNGGDAHTLAHTIVEKDDFIILASKGLWAVMEKQKAVDLVTEFLTVFGDSRAASEELMDEALRKYKSDVSVVIVWFKDIIDK